MPSRTHHAESFDKRANVVVANGTPLSLRIRVGSPYSLNSRVKIGFASSTAGRDTLPPFSPGRTYNLLPMDERAFARLAEQYAARLYTVAFRLLGNRADAEDAVQRTLLNSFANRASYSSRWAVSTWLYRVLSNVCIDELRRRRRPTAEAPPRATSAATIERIDLARALERVPREARLLLALHYVDGLSYKDLAAIRGISINTVKSQLARGKAVLRGALTQGGDDGRH